MLIRVLSVHRSLGCTIVEMLTVNPPWHEFETMAAIYKIATCDFKAQYSLPSGSSDLAHDILNRCFQSPESRPSAEELLRHRFCKEHR